MLSFESLPDWLSDPLVLGLILLVISALIFNLWSRLRRRSIWGQIAKSTGLREVKSSRGKKMTGMFRGRKISLEEKYVTSPRQTRHDSDGDGRNLETMIFLAVKGLKGASLNIRRTNLLGDLAAPLIGEPELERHFSVSGDPDWFAQEVLAAAHLRQSLPNLKNNCSIFVYGSNILFSTNRRLLDIDYLEFLFTFLSDLAEVVEGIAKQHGPIQTDTPDVGPEAAQAVEGLEAFAKWFDRNRGND